MISSYNLDTEKPLKIELDLNKNLSIFGTHKSGKKTLLRFLLQKEIKKDEEQIIIFIAKNQNLSKNIEYFIGFENKSDKILFYDRELKKSYFTNIANEKEEAKEEFEKIVDIFDLIENKIIILNNEEEETSSILLNSIYKEYFDKDEENATLPKIKIFVEDEALIGDIHESIFALNDSFPISMSIIFNEFETAKEIKNTEKVFFNFNTYNDMSIIADELFLSTSELKDMYPGMFYYKRSESDIKMDRLLNYLPISKLYEADYEIALLKEESEDIDFLYFNDKLTNDLYIEFLKIPKNEKLDKLAFYLFKTMEYFKFDEIDYISSETISRINGELKTYEPQYIIDNITTFNKITLKDFIIDSFEVALSQKPEGDNLYATLMLVYSDLIKAKKIKTMVDVSLFIDENKLLRTSDYKLLKELLILFKETTENDKFDRLISIYDEKEIELITFIDDVKHQARDIEMELFETETVFNREKFRAILEKKDEEETEIKEKELEEIEEELKIEILPNKMLIYRNNELSSIIFPKMIKKIDIETKTTPNGNKIFKLIFILDKLDNLEVNVTNENIIEKLLKW